MFTADEAERLGTQGERVILVRRETTPGRLPRDDRGAGHPDQRRRDQLARRRGGARRGIPAVCGADAIKLSPAEGTFHANGTSVKEGDVITIDGFTGNVYVGELPLEESVLEKARGGDAAAREEPIWQAFEALMAHADEVRRLRVRANADTPDQARNARERGAEGIGLCRTEHMFLGEERVSSVRDMIFAETEEEERKVFDKLAPLQREDFVGIFRAMDGTPGDGAPPRPAAPRVPAGPGGGGGPGRPRGGAGRGRHREEAPAAEGERAARGQPDARDSAACAWGS